MIEKGVGIAISAGVVIYFCLVVFVVTHFIVKFW